MTRDDSASSFLERLSSRAARLIAIIPLSIFIASCGGGGGNGNSVVPTPSTYTAKSGVAQKGPLIKGSTVTAQELDVALSPTGKQYSYQIDSDLGTFTPTSTFGSQFLGLNASGYYFDEVENDISSGTVTLEGYSDLSTDTVVNVNILTTLAYQRIRNLVVNSNMTVSAARQQAESEALAALNIPGSGYGTFGTFDMSGSTDGDHILAAISSLFVYGNQAGPLSALINDFQSDLGTNGALTNPSTKAALSASAKALNPDTIAANLDQRYAALGVTLTGADIADWIDQDGDGVVGKFKFQVSDATPASTFTLPTFVVNAVAGTSVSVTAGQLTVNAVPVSGALVVNTGDVVRVSPGAGSFPNGVLDIYLLSQGTKFARVSFVNGLLFITVTPAAPGIAKGLTQQFTAAGTFSDTSTADLTKSVTWTSTTPAVAIVNSTGLAQSVATGTTTITAASASISASASLTVTAAVLESLAITPTSPHSGVGLTRRLTAIGTYSDGTTGDVGALAKWTSSAPAVATVGNQTGLTTGVSLGSTNISATTGSMTQSVTLAIVGRIWSQAAQSNPHVAHTATLLPNGKVLVAGGQVMTSKGTVITAFCEIYDFVADIWSGSASLLTERQGHTATLLSNGKVLVTGGSGTQAVSYLPLSSVEIYDPVANTWTRAADMSTTRVNHTATLLPNGKVLVVGGTGGGPVGPLASAEIYDPVANTWSPAATLPAATYGHTATLLADGRVLIAGGTVLTGPNSYALASSALVYDPSANTWASTGSLSHPRYQHTATLLSNGSVLITGGADGGVGVAAGTTEIYNPATNSWSPGGTLLAARESHTASLLPSGRILLAGGTGPTTSSSELYDPATNTSVAAASLIAAGYLQSATLLSNGAVLVVGGRDSSDNLIASPELYW